MINDYANASSTGDPSPAVTCAPCDGVVARPVPRPRRPPVPRRVVAFGLALAVVLVVPGVSLTQALTYPGSAPWQMRSVEWLRAHGGSPLVDRIENWYYTSNLPTGSAPNQASLPVAAPGVAAAGRSAPPWPRPPQRQASTRRRRTAAGYRAGSMRKAPRRSTPRSSDPIRSTPAWSPAWPGSAPATPAPTSSRVPGSQPVTAGQEAPRYNQATFRSSWPPSTPAGR